MTSHPLSFEERVLSNSVWISRPKEKNYDPFFALRFLDGFEDIVGSVEYFEFTECECEKYKLDVCETDSVYYSLFKDSSAVIVQLNLDSGNFWLTLYDFTELMG